MSEDKKAKSLAATLLPIVKKMKAKSVTRERDRVAWLKNSVERMFRVSYNKFFRRKVVVYGLWAYSIYFAVVKIWDILTITTSPQKMMMLQRFYEDYNFFGKSDVYMIVFKMAFDLIASILFLLGAGYFWSKKRNRGIRYFKYGLYVSIFLVSIFRFYFEQFGGIVELLISVAILQLLNLYKSEINQ